MTTLKTDRPPEPPVTGQPLPADSDYSFVQRWYHLAGKGHFWIEWRFRVLRYLLQRNRVPLSSMRGVDIGCGNGFLRKQIESVTEWTMDGIELDRQAQHFDVGSRGQFYWYDVRSRDPALAGKYDVLTLFDIIEHYPEDDDLLDAALFHLRQGGYCIINVPALQSMYSLYDSIAGHVKRYTLPELHQQAERAGLRVVDIRYWGFSLIPPLWLRRFYVGMRPDLSPDEIIGRGFTPPPEPFHGLIKLIAAAEAWLLRRPPVGASIMLLAVKR